MQTPVIAPLPLPLDIGVDVAKDEVVVACAAGSFATLALANQRAALQGWLKGLPAGSRIGMEATGTYFETLADLAHAQGLQVFVLNPKDVKHYAKGIGRRGKTDRVDAGVIARFIAHEHAHLHPYVTPSRQQRTLDRLLKRRARLVTIGAAVKQSLAGLSGVRREMDAIIARIEALIDKIDALTRDLLHKLPAQWRTFEHLQSIVGIGPLAGAYLTNTFARLPFANVNAFIAHTGLDPRPDDSGKKVGRRRLSKRGPAELRRLLFNCAMSAAKSRLWKPFYAQQRAKGLSSTAAIIVLARKLARIAFAVFKQQTTFDPQKHILMA
jgi:transposase